MLVDLGVKDLRLLTNNPDKVRAVEGPNREIVVKERVAMIPLAWRKGGVGGIRSEEVGGYLKTKVRSNFILWRVKLIRYRSRKWDICYRWARTLNDTRVDQDIIFRHQS
jgi:hypothetical protein